jgi:hypothetical protein
MTTGSGTGVRRTGHERDPCRMRLLTANDIEDDDENEDDRRGEGSILANEDISRYKMSAVGRSCLLNS